MITSPNSIWGPSLLSLVLQLRKNSSTVKKWLFSSLMFRNFSNFLRHTVLRNRSVTIRPKELIPMEMLRWIAHVRVPEEGLHSYRT